MNNPSVNLELTTFNTQDSTVVYKYSDGSFDEFSEEEEEIPKKPCCRYRPKSRRCCVFIYLCLALICASSLASVIVVGLIICVPYHSAQEFVDASCRISHFAYLSSQHVCSCGRRCISSYPCIIVSVEVEYIPYVSRDRWEHAQIYEDETKLSRKVRISVSIICYLIC